MQITIFLIAVHVIIYIFMEVIGDTNDAFFMMQHGALYPTSIIEGKEYYRLVTAGFLHFGFEHLFHNMIMLAAAGRILEEALGKFKYLLLYMVAGIGGTSLSLLQMMYSGEYSVSAGASGAIFGIIGALVWIVVLHKGRYQSLTGRGLVMLLVLSFYFGITAGNVDNWGHIGGLLAGFFMNILLYRKDSKKEDVQGFSELH